MTALPISLSREREETSFASVTAAVVWISCVAVGVIGFVIPYARPMFAAKALPPIQAQIVHVQLTSPDYVPSPAAAVAPQPPRLEKASLPPAAPALTPVAAPSATVAFALPIKGPTRVVESREAAYAAPANEPQRAAANSTPVPLTFGVGEGIQPAPEYPARAQREHQTGVVQIVLDVGRDGRVTSAEVAAPSPWPLLNEAALRAVREKWRFSAGPERRWIVPIKFQLRR